MNENELLDETSKLKVKMEQEIAWIINKNIYQNKELGQVPAVFFTSAFAALIGNIVNVKESLMKSANIPNESVDELIMLLFNERKIK